MSLLNNGAFMHQFEQSKINSKRRAFHLNDEIFGGMLFDVQQWHNHKKYIQVDIPLDNQENVILTNFSRNCLHTFETTSTVNQTNQPNTSPVPTPPEQLPSIDAIFPTSSPPTIANESTIIPIQPNHLKSNGYYHCRHCSKSFDRQSSLERHLRMHTGERPFQCDQCGKRFGHKSSLKTHLRAHSGERPFHCDQCDRRFTLKHNLTTHLLIHKNIKRFQCDHCGRRFTLKFSLKTHLRTHERPFQCKFCKKSFCKLNARYRHEKAKHRYVYRGK